jgi:TonB family protein
VLDVIPANLIDAQFNSGVRGAQPPPPDLQPAPQPPAAQPVVSRPPPTPAPEPVVKPEPVKPTPAPDKVEPHKIQIDTHLVTRNASQKTSTPDNSAQQARALRKAIRSLKQNFSPSTTVDMPGTSSVAYASYRDVIGSIYYQAWTPPDETSNDNAIVKARIEIASDGTVVSAHIITPSGDAKVDDSVQRTLERVTFIAPFPEGMTEKERPFTISFNLKTKRMLE